MVVFVAELAVVVGRVKGNYKELIMALGRQEDMGLVAKRKLWEVLLLLVLLWHKEELC